jgi:hypothetical protein
MTTQVQRGTEREAGRCYLCCEPLEGRPELGTATADHFIPHCFYENRRVPDEPDLCLPAHLECNRSTSLDEEWVFINFALSSPIGLRPWGERQERAKRALLRATPKNPGGLMTRYIAGTTILPGGDFMHTRIGTDRVTWVLAKLAKGLTFRTSGQLLGPDTLWTTRYTDYAAFIQEARPWAVDVPSRGPSRGDVLVAKGFLLEGCITWRIELLGALPAVITTMSPEILVREKTRGTLLGWDDGGKHDFMRLQWPKPRRAAPPPAVEAT